MKKIIIVLIIFISVIAGIYLYRNTNVPQSHQKKIPEVVRVTASLEKAAVIAQNLEVPWAIALLPNNDMLITERKGQIIRINQNGNVESVINIDEVLQIGEGGLLGIAAHPDFTKNNYIYAYYTYAADGNQTLNRVVRYFLKNNALIDKKIIIDRIPGAQNHNGGRIKFGPDGFLYIATGDAQEPSLAQDINSLAGKILRVDSNGRPAPGNPFNNAIFSYGHRNPQGLTWINNELWATEHGPSTRDELNRIEQGKNYGWPTITGNEQRAGMQTPVINSGSDTWAPSGLVDYKGILYFAGLRGNALYSFDPNNPENGVKEYFKIEFGRLREVVLGTDGNFYITTSNKDGRGIPDEGDDKILRINPDIL